MFLGLTKSQATKFKMYRPSGIHINSGNSEQFIIALQSSRIILDAVIEPIFFILVLTFLTKDKTSLLIINKGWEFFRQPPAFV